VQAVPGAEARQALLGMARPVEAEPAHSRVARRRGQLQHHVPGGALRDLEADVDVHRVAERLVRDDALGELDELVLDLPVAHVRRDGPDEAPAISAHGHAERGPGDLDGGHRCRVPHRRGDSVTLHRTITTW
jgi:hypothetical protein